MEIFYIAHFDCTTNEGNAAHVRGVVQELETQGHCVTLFAQNWNSVPKSQVRYVHVPQWRWAGFYALSFGLASLPLLLWHLITHSPDIVYTRFFTALVFVAPLCALFKVPLVVELNADQATEHDAYGRQAWKRALWSWSERLTYRHTAGLVAVAPAIIESLHRRFPALQTPTVVVENGVDTTEFYPQDAGLCRDELDLDPKGHYVVYVGAFQIWQGIPTLIESAPAVLEIFPDTKFLLVGDPGPQGRQILERIAALGVSKQFVLPGSCAPQQAARFIGAGDVCVAPYNRLSAFFSTETRASCALMKGSPLKVFAYMACGRPVVASHFCEAGVFVEEAGAGLSVPPEDAKALGAAIVTLLADPDLRKRMGARGSARIRTHHSWQAVTGRLTAFFSKVVTP